MRFISGDNNKEKLPEKFRFYYGKCMQTMK